MSINLEKYVQNASQQSGIETFDQNRMKPLKKVVFFSFFTNNLVFGGVIKPNLAQINTPNHVLIVTYGPYDYFMHWSKVKTFHFFINPL